MTKEEYERKLDAYKASDAPVEVKEKAIAELDAKYNEGIAANRARQDFLESQPDLDDIN